MSLAKEKTPPLNQTALLDPCSLSRLSGLKLDPHGHDLHDQIFSHHTNTMNFAAPNNFSSQPSHRPLINFKAGADHRRSPAAYSSTPAVLSFDRRVSNGSDQGSLISWIDDVINGDDEPMTSDATCFKMIQEKGSHKRPSMDDEMQDSKKNCGNGRKQANYKAKESSSKDPQSIAAKNRRERISERLKILQDLVPNGKKVDLVTMLEKAISYVKFLQLQVKVLNTDEFWPAAGGKAPEASQVKEAINAILSSHRGRNSTSY